MMNLDKEELFEELKRCYETPIFMSGISNIDNHFNNDLPEQDMKDCLSKSRTYTIHFELHSQNISKSLF